MKDNGGMDFLMDLEEYYMMMVHFTKVALTMARQNVNKLYS